MVEIELLDMRHKLGLRQNRLLPLLLWHQDGF